MIHLQYVGLGLTLTVGGWKYLNISHLNKLNMTQYCDYSSTFQFTQALPGANEPTERVFFSMNNMWCGMMPNRKSKPKLLRLRFWSPQKHQRVVLCLDFHELIKSNNWLLKWKRKERDRRYSIGRGHKTFKMVIRPNMKYNVYYEV